MKRISYKDALAELENILQQIENNEPDVDELAGLVKRATELLAICKSKLKNTEIELNQALDKLNQ